MIPDLMMTKIKIRKIIRQYDKSDITIATLGSHSALEICRGAKDEGFSTLVVCQAGREKTYHDFYRTRNELGCVDSCIIVEKFSDLLNSSIQHELIKRNSIFIPHRSFEVYLDFDYQAIENDFVVPMFGNRYLLKVEERGIRPNQYDLLAKAGIRYPKIFSNPKDIDRLCLVKVLEKERGFERAFFLVKDYNDYQKQVDKKIQEGVFTETQLRNSVIEEFLVGVQVNFNFYYSPIYDQLELLGTDTRRQTNLEGLTRIPADYQREILRRIPVKYEEAGHIAVTVLESLLEQVFAMGNKFVRVTKELIPPGIIGPFALQSIIIPGPPKKEIVVVDVSPRVPGSPGIVATPYSYYLFGESMGVGKRIAREIKEAIASKSIERIVS